MGQGITVDRVFERFQQVDASTFQRQGGTGLGLAIGKQIVEQHGGEICVESQLGISSTLLLHAIARIVTGRGS
jgi:signal transduction histidine kinase